MKLKIDYMHVGWLLISSVINSFNNAKFNRDNDKAFNGIDILLVHPLLKISRIEQKLAFFPQIKAEKEEGR